MSNNAKAKYFITSLLITKYGEKTEIIIAKHHKTTAERLSDTSFRLSYIVRIRAKNSMLPQTGSPIHPVSSVVNIGKTMKNSVSVDLLNMPDFINVTSAFI